jgi:hypothetical protein
VKALPEHMPEEIKVDITNLDINGSLKSVTLNSIMSLCLMQRTA